MSLDEKDLKEIGLVIAEQFEELVFPKFDTLNVRLDAIDRRLDKLDSSAADSRTNQLELIDAHSKGRRSSVPPQPRRYDFYMKSAPRE